jgi:mono/diheme cytochrome c family protein
MRARCVRTLTDIVEIAMRWPIAQLACLSLLGTGIVAGGVSPAAPSLVSRPSQAAQPAEDGQQLFNTYCASCHGVTGVGNGPAAMSMRRKPPDITGLALANGGMFPAERMRRIIDGREIEAHGNRDMPVWGDAFKAIRGGYSEESVRARIGLIVEYLASIQRQRT